MGVNKPNIAVVTITMNDGYKFKEWCQHYEEYKDELYLHIIVDNHSEKDYLEQVKSFFKTSVIIERETNGGCTLSYNDGIRYALNDPKVEFIALVGNDCRIDTGGLIKCAEFIINNNGFGMVSPIMFKKGGTNIIEDYGDNISDELTLIEHMSGKCILDVKEPYYISQALPGGLNVSCREFYEKVGLQDEMLFMYSDEVDMGLRAEKCGFKLASISYVHSWHEHVNENKKTNRRFPFSRYLIGRNKVYLAGKHFGNKKKRSVFCYFILYGIKGLFKGLIKCDFPRIQDSIWSIRGAYYGFRGKMEPNKYSHL